MPKTHARLDLLTPALGLVLVTAYSAGQTAQLRSQPKPRQPYTAEFKITTVRTLANGTTITRESTETQAVDRDGRTVNLTKESAVNSDRPAVMRGHVHDPVEETDINWDSVQGKATIVKAPPADQREGCWATESGHMRWQFGSSAQSSTAAKSVETAHLARPKPVMEELGTTTIEGVEAHGRRTTWTTPAGQIGNDAPLVRTQETWWGTSIGLLLREVNDDPQTGKRTREVVSLGLTDPDPALFQPPEGYEVKTETAHPVACE